MEIKNRVQSFFRRFIPRSLVKRYSHEVRHLTARTGEEVNVTNILLDMLTQREAQNELPWLTPQRAVELYEAWRRGELADIQRAWEQLEETDDTLMTVLDKRQRALAAMPWEIMTDAAAIGDDEELTQKAKLQQAYLRAVFNAVENLEDAFVHLGMADFRGVAALEITGTMQRMRWEVIEPWCLARPSRRGPWMYNARADSTFRTLETLDAEAVIIREARPIDLAVMFLIVDKNHAIHGWDSFLDVFGNPSIFLELPSATSESMAKVYDALAKRIIGDGRGTIPNGSKFQTVETRQNNCDSFEKRAKWCREAIITVATGGLLTVAAESGSGTLAGNAHTDSFENLVAGSAASISAAINKQFTRRLLARAFPDEPPLAYFSLAPEPADERLQLAQLLATLKTAGWQTTAEKASELMQMDLEAVQEQAQPAPMPGEVLNTEYEYTPVANRGEGETGEPPLTADELAAFELLKMPNPARMQKRLAEVERALREGADLPQRPAVKNRAPIANDGPGGPDCEAQSAERCRCGKKKNHYLAEYQRQVMERRGLTEKEAIAILDRQRSGQEWQAINAQRKKIDSIPENAVLENSKGYRAMINERTKKKILSNDAINKSNLNGYTDGEHARAAADIERIWRRASFQGDEEPHAIGKRGKMIFKRYRSTHREGKNDIPVLLTVKHFLDGKQDDTLYSLELMP